jgi:hypothetical protein
VLTRVSIILESFMSNFLKMYLVYLPWCMNLPSLCYLI